MLNKLVYILLVAFLFSACKSSKNLPEGAPAVIKRKALDEEMAAAKNTYNTLRLLGTGHFDDGKTSQSFRLEVRIAHDSLIWLDVADPILGIKVARAVVYKDSVAFVNRLEKEYFTGRVADLQRKFKLEFGFETLQGILSANMLFAISKDFELYYRPGAYLLSDFNPDPKGEQEGMEKYFGKTVFQQVYVDTKNYKPATQVQREPAFGKSYVVENENLKTFEDGLVYPENISITYTQNEATKVKIEAKKVSKNEDGLNFPFNIPSSYAKMR